MHLNKNSTLVIVLISVTQLVIMLIVVGLIYQYSQAEMVRQAQSHIYKCHEYVARLVHTNLSTLSGDVAKERETRTRIEYRTKRMGVSNQGFAMVVDKGQHKVRYATDCVSGFEAGNDLSDASVTLESGQTLPFSQLVEQNPEMIANGKLTFGGKDFLITGLALDSVKGYIVVGKDTTMIDAKIAAGTTSLRKTAFGSVLLVGLIGTCLSLVLLKRYEQNQLAYSEELKQNVKDRTEDLENTQRSVIYGLAKLAESRDNDTGDHLMRIQSFVTILARALSKTHPEIDAEYIDNLALASSLHDIGKVGVPDAILLKAGRLTMAERNIMELHTVIGGDCLKSIQTQLGRNDFLEMAREIALGHHERWDGDGYPRGRRETDIPLCARIVSVADVYDALRSKRPYKQPMSHLESRAIILSGIGSQFDPEVVNAFLENEKEFELISEECSKLTQAEVTPKIEILSEMIKKS